MNDLGMYLRSILRKERYGSINYKIAEYLLNNYDEIQELSTTLLAEKCHVSKSSISRFCKAIGVEDFAELKFLIKRQSLNIEEKFFIERYSNDAGQDYLSFVDKSFHKMERFLDYNLLDQLVKSIYQYDNVVLMGISKSLTPAINLQHDLVYLRKWVYCTDDIAEQKEILMNSGKDTLIIIFSASGSFFQKVLPRDRVMQREQIPCIYMVSCQPIFQTPYIYGNLVINDEVDFSSHLLMDIVAHLIVVRYKVVNHI